MEDILFAQHFHAGGIKSGIQPIDKRHGGFMPGQLIAVIGPIQKINHSFLFSLGINASIEHKKKVDVILTETNLQPSYLNQFSKDQYSSIILTNKSGTRESRDPRLRFINLDYGRPKFDGWKRYLQVLKENPPDLLILDGTYSIKEFLEVKNIALDLLNIVKESNIIVAVNTSWPSMSMLTDSQFEERANVFIRFNPHYFLYRKNRDASMVKTFYIETSLSTIQSNVKCGNYSTVFELIFTDEGNGVFEEEL